jgi:UDP-glucose 4-epimerase
MKKVLVTGGAGFIGSHTVDLLLAENIPVRVLDNLSSGHRSNLPDSHPLLEFVEGDITNCGTVKEVMQGVSHCLHLAAQVSVEASIEDPVNSAMQNIIGFINIQNSAQNEGVERLVYASSAAIYGEPSEIPLPEDTQKLQLSPYGLEKQVNEEYADLYRRSFGFSSLGLRFFNVYGPRQDPKSPYAGVIALFVDRISQGRSLSIYGDGKQTRDFIYVGDVAEAILAALACQLSGACNIATGRQITLLELIEVLSAITGNQCEVSFESARDGDIRHSLANVERMHRELGISAQTAIEQGLTQLLSN